MNTAMARVSWRLRRFWSTVCTLDWGLAVAPTASTFCQRIGWFSLSWTIRCALATTAFEKFFLAMHHVAGDDMARQVEFLHQLLRGGDLVRFSSISMAENRRRIDRERAEQLPCLGVVEVVETALQRLAVERDDARLGARRSEIRIRGVVTEDLFDIGRAQPSGSRGSRYAPAASST